MQVNQAVRLFLVSVDGIVSPATVRFYLDRLPRFEVCFQGREIESITLDELREWRRSITRKASRYGGNGSRPEIQGGYSVYTVHQFIRCVKRLYKWLHDDGKIPANPARRLELPQLPHQVRRGISERDRDRIILAAGQSARDLAICLFLADTACRVGGLVGMNVDDLDLELRRAVVREKGRGGASKARWVFYGDKTTRALENWIIIRAGCPRINTNALFCARSGERLSRDGVYNLLGRLAERAGVGHGWNPHNWRHGAIRGMLRRGMTLTAAAQIAGHSSCQLTGDLYGTFCEDELAELHDRFSWLSDSQLRQHPTRKPEIKQRAQGGDGPGMEVDSQQHPGRHQKTENGEIDPFELWAAGIDKPDPVTA